MATASNKSKWAVYGLWVLSIMLAAMFLMAGGMKLSGAEQLRAGFERWGIPIWFMYVTGAVEVSAAIGLLIPRLSATAAAGLVATMIGGIGIHVVFAEWGAIVPPFVLMMLSLVVLYGRREYLPILGKPIQQEQCEGC